MLTVGIDTSNKYLVIALIKEGKTIDSIQMPCFKSQSEQMIPQLKKLMAKGNYQSEDIEAMVITDGPGSYTGIRIAMSVAKVFCSSAKLPLYTLSSLQLMCGNSPKGLAIMDARGNRVYVGGYTNGKAALTDTIMTTEEVSKILNDYELFGDLSLFGLSDNYPDLANNFAILKDQWKKVENIDALCPQYLKDSQEYLIK